MREYLWNPWRSAGATPGRLAVVAGERWYSFAELTDRADRLCRGFAALGLADGAVVGTSLPSGPELFALILAAFRSGIGIFPVSPAWGADMRSSLLRAAGAVLDVTLDATLDVTGARPAGAAVRCITATELAAAGRRGQAGDLALDGQPGGAASATPAGFLIFATSGTTGGPVVVSRARPWHPYRGVAVRESYGAGADRGPHVMANPTFHLGTLGPALYALQAGSAVIVQEQWSPSRFRELVDQFGADSAFVSPDQLTSLAEAGEVPGHPLRVLFHGGAPTAPEVKQKVIDLFGPIVHEFYGTSTGIVSEVSAAEWLARPGTAGRPLPGVKVSVRRGDIELPGGEIGRIHVRYRATDRGTSASEYCDTTDLGYVDDAGYLYVLGRDAGVQGGTALLEHLVRQVPGITDVAAILADSGEIACYLECSKPVTPGLYRQVNDLAKRLGIYSVAVLARPDGAFPRTPSGKLWRARLQDAGYRTTAERS